MFHGLRKCPQKRLSPYGQPAVLEDADNPAEMRRTGPGWQACMLRLLHEVVEQDLNLSFAFEFPTNAKRSLGANVYLTSI